MRQKRISTVEDLLIRARNKSWLRDQILAALVSDPSKSASAASSCPRNQLPNYTERQESLAICILPSYRGVFRHKWGAVVL